MADGEIKSRYHYDASVPAAVVFAIIYGLLLIAHSTQAFRLKTRYMVPLIIGCALEMLGYITRFVSIKNPEPLLPLIISETGIVVAPAFMAAQDYMIVGRIMSYVGPGYSFISHSKLTKIFVVADVIAILTQSGGGAMMASGKSLDSMKLAKNILIGGLCLQVVVFGVFLLIAILFDRNSRRGLGKQAMSPLRPLFLAFYTSGILITARSIYRAYEFTAVSFTPGVDTPQGYAVTHEWCLYVFDTLPIVFAVIVLNVYHPGRFLPAKKGLRMDGTYEDETNQKASHRGANRIEPLDDNSTTYLPLEPARRV